VPGSVRIRPEQITAVTDSVPEQRRPDRTITTFLLFEKGNAGTEVEGEFLCNMQYTVSSLGQWHVWMFVM